MRTWLDIATLTKTKGMDGGFAVAAAAGLPFLFSEGMQVHLAPPVIDAPRIVTVTSAAASAEGAGKVRFDEIASIDEAQMLIGCHCIVARDDVEGIAEAMGIALDAAALSGGFADWLIRDEALGDVGIVVDAVEHPTQLTLTVRDAEGVEHMIPLVDELIASIDEDERVLTMRLPRGLLEV